MSQAEGFVARCQQCGAPHTIVLGAPLAACAYCRAPQPLAPDESLRVAEAASLVAKVAVHEHRRLLNRRVDAETLLAISLASSGGSWVVLGGAAFYIAAQALPDGVGVTAALLGRAPESAGATWALYSLLLGVAATISLLLWAYLRVRTSGVPPVALPPLPGGNPRCRLCGGGLGSSGAVRVCRWCGASNLIDGGALQAHVGGLLEQLAELRAAEVVVTEEAHSIVFSAAKFSALYPLLVPLVAAAAGELSGVWYPELLLLIPLALLPAGVALCWLPFCRAYRVRRFSETRPGDIVRVAGQPHHVHSVVLIYPGAALPGELRLLTPSGAQAPTLALHVQEIPDNWGCAYEVSAGGAGLSEPTLTRARVSSLGTPPVPAAAQQAGNSLRIFPEGAAPGTSPWWTLSPASFDGASVFVP